MGVILPEDAKSGALGNALHYPTLLEATALFTILGNKATEVAAGTIDSAEISQVSIDKKGLPGSNIVEQPTHNHNLAQFVIGQALVEHRKVVAEIKIGLARIALGQSASAEMIDLAVGNTHYLASLKAQTPAEVYFLVVGKEAPVESVGIPIVLGAHQNTGTSSPEYFLSIVVLTVIALHGIEYPAATEGITVFVYKPAASPCILERIFVCP